MDGGLVLLPPGLESWEEAMGLALEQAELAREAGEVPVGAVLLGENGEILARAMNAPIGASDPTAHAEMNALRLAAQTLGNYRLTGCVLVSTLEPCLMCLGAMVHARVAGLVFGAFDPKAGVLGSRMSALELPFLNHRFPVLPGIRAEECGALLTDFFRERR
jgi:tRNA(adenine34) deaminase